MDALKTLVAASAAGQPLGIDHPIGGFRPMAHVFGTSTGLAFADHGWDGLWAIGGHPLHAVDGQVRQAGKCWIIDMPRGQRAMVVPLSRGDLRRLQLAPWAPGDRGRCLEAIRRPLAPDAWDVAP
jgi:hypothetical protein